ncbi:hypothetical protein AAF712_001198 [Marasmius tenuissimus]|uniref:Ketoreductase (KR) domain-containing protein n=1 Tax=Marasmius tenuissimus TaxID=585030 RepID=A0ABR3ABJ8_9AGAR
MVLAILATAANNYFPTQYTTHIVLGLLATYTLYIVFQGRKTSRERTLHGRVVLITGAFTPVGITLLQQLAERGAHIIALTPYPVAFENVSSLIEVLRSTTKNELIYAEQCDLNSPASIQAFCKRFLLGEDKRLDAIIFAHEYETLGSFGFVTKETAGVQDERDRRSLATFLLTTLLLPSLLAAPSERDIRIVNVVNRFYAAAVPDPVFFYSNLFPSFAPTAPEKPKKSASLFFEEGRRALQTIILTRHLQRVLDALPSAQVPQASAGSTSVPVVSAKNQRSNIVAMSVSPGVSRSDTIGRMLTIGSEAPTSWLGVLLYTLFYPLLRIFTKGPTFAIQSILHVLFLPTPFKLIINSEPTESQEQKDTTKDSPSNKRVARNPQEVLKPGALYAECATVVGLRLPPPHLIVKPSEEEDKKGKGKQKAEATTDEPAPRLPDDNEFGGERAGTLVWEAYEAALRVWQKSSPTLEEYEREMKEHASKAKTETEESNLETVAEGTEE